MKKKSPIALVRPGDSDETVWVSTATALRYFDIGFSTLYRHRDSGLFKLGVHYLDLSDPNSKQSSYRWNLAALTAAWSVPPEYREPATA
jgi:hypothetical protein